MKPACCGCWRSITGSSNKLSLIITARHQNYRRCLPGGLPLGGPCRAGCAADSGPVTGPQHRKENADQIHVRIGIHLGDIVQREGDVFGDGVNVASRCKRSLSPTPFVSLTKSMKKSRRNSRSGTVVSLGRPKLKNIAQRETVYALLAEHPQESANICKSNG